MSKRMNKERAREVLERHKKYCNKVLENAINRYTQLVGYYDDIPKLEELLQALDIAIESLEHQVNEKDEIKLVCPKCKREWTKPIGEFCSSCGTEMVVEPYERKE